MLQRESYKLQHQAYMLNFEANSISRKTRMLNRDSTLAAQITSSTTRMNLLMIWVSSFDTLLSAMDDAKNLAQITAPCILVLQYFGADQPIFHSFERSPRNFAISLCVLALVFPLFTWICHCIYSLSERLVRKTKRDRLLELE
jgi:hypothetical protein